MNINKCDVCKKTIKEKDNKYTLQARKPWAHLDICENCGKPMEAILKKAVPEKS